MNKIEVRSNTVFYQLGHVINIQAQTFKILSSCFYFIPIYSFFKIIISCFFFRSLRYHSVLIFNFSDIKRDYKIKI